jgi:DNA-binding NarL/FixJ family response regulator
VVVIDADLPEAACLAAMATLTCSGVDPVHHPVFICLAVYPDLHDAALQAGAIRFLRKDGSARELLEAVREAAQVRAIRIQQHADLEDQPSAQQAG